MRRRAFSSLMVSSLALSSAPRGLAQQAVSFKYPEALRIGYPKASTLGILRARGSLEKELAPLGVAVKWVEFAFGPPLVEALNAGSIDVGWVGTTPPVFAQAGSAPNIRYVGFSAAYGDNYGLIVPKESAARKVADLRGKRIAAAKGSGGQYLVLKALEVSGLSEKDVDVRYLQYSEASAAFQQGSIDAWAVPDPQFAQVQMLLGARAVATASDVPRHYAFFIAPEAFARQHGHTLSILLSALNAAESSAKADPVGTAAFLGEQTKIPAAVWETALRRQSWGAFYPLTPEVVASQQLVADTFFNGGNIPRAINVQDFVVSIKRDGRAG